MSCITWYVEYISENCIFKRYLFVFQLYVKLVCPKNIKYLEQQEPKRLITFT